MDFFVSHAGRDQAWAEWVAWHLVEAGYTVELDCWDWAAGENFVTKMHRAMDAANRVVALFSQAYFEDLRYTSEEWTSALVKDGDGGHRLVPVQVEPCAVPRLLSPLLRVELFDVGEAEAARRLIAAAQGPARPDGKPVFPGEDHPDTLFAAHYFADCLHEVGAFEQARQLNVDTFARRRRVLGEDHIDSQRTAHNLARDLRELGEVEAARQLHEDCFAYRRRALGDDNPLTMNTASELGRDLHALGDIEAARHLGEDTLARARRVLGDDSHFTMHTANNLAAALHAAGEFEAARQLSADTLARARRVFGDDHPRTRKAAGNLAAAQRLLREPAHQGDSGPVDEP